MSLIHNERTKLTATAVNGLAIAFAAAGFIAPMVARSFGVQGAAPGLIRATAFSVVWLLVGAVLHMVARAILGRLK